MPRLIALTRLARQAVLVRPNCSQSRPNLSLCSHSVRRFNSDPPEMYPPSNEPTIPEFIEKFNEPLEEKRSRLIYQSRKRGMLENGLLLGSFAKKFLPAMDEEKLVLYDRLINLPSNDWEIYYWAVGQKETPEDFDNVVMDMLKQHAKNENRESRITMPDLN